MKVNVYKLIAILAMLFLAVGLSAFTMYSGSRTLSGSEWFYDTGDSSGQYQNGENYYLTLYPPSLGYMVTVQLYTFSTEVNFDYLRVYNGPNTGYTMLRQWNGEWSDVSSYTYVQSSSPDGSLTLWWYSDGSVVRDGWQALVSYTYSPVAPSAPSAYAGSSITSSSFTANWSSCLSANNYQLQVTTDSSFNSINVFNSWVGNTTSYNVTGLSTGYTYYYRVYASNGWTSPVSNTVQVTTPPNTPAILAASGVTSSGFRANWSHSTGASAYYLDLSTTSNFSSNIHSYLYVGYTTYYDFTGLNGNTNYYYRVRAYNAGGYSGDSLVMQVLTNIANPSSVSATPSTINSGESSLLNATSNNANIRWFTSPTGGTSLGTSSSGANISVNPSETTTYYAEAYSGATAVNPLQSILNNLNINYANITSQIPQMYTFNMDGSGGVNANNINDGGGDMYDTGNYLATNYQSQMYYSDNSVISSSIFGTGGAYFTRYVSGLFVLAADMNNVTYFQVTGGNGADGGGSVNGTTLNITVNGVAYSCYLKRVYNAGDPSINQMIIIPQNSSASHWYDTSTTDSSGQHVININASTRLYYLLYAGSSGYYIDDSNATNIATAFLTQVNAASAEQISASRTAVTVTVRNIPQSASIDSPINEANNVPISANLIWQAPSSGDAPSGYKVHFGTQADNLALVATVESPSLSYDLGNLDYSTLYYWQIVPTNLAGDASSCPVWSFTTTNQYTATLPPVETGNPEIPPFTPEIEIPSIVGSFQPIITTGWNPPETPFDNTGLYIQITGAQMNGRLVILNPNLGFVPQMIMYRIEPSLTWQFVGAEVDWTATYVYFTVPGSKADGDLEILFPDSEDGTLAITLSSFTAIFAASTHSVRLQWLVESETNHLGYNVLRCEFSDIQNATRLNANMICEGNYSGSQISYLYQDFEVYPNSTYYYWLESVSMDGETHFHGPVLANTTQIDPGEGGTAPAITTLFDAYPNPFNPITTISYAMKNADKVFIDIYNIRGEKVYSYTADHNFPGIYRFSWNAKNEHGIELPSGTYFYRMRSGKFSASKKMVLLK